MNSRLLQGVVEMLVLEVLSRGPNYGYQIAQTVLEESRAAFELKEGSLYPALHRMEREKLLASRWVDAEEGRRRKYYKLTAAGRRALVAKSEEWRRFTIGVDGVLGDARELA